MLSPQVRKKTLRLQQQWTPAERVIRARLGRYRCARLLVSVCITARDLPEPWTTGAMSLADLQRIAG